MLDFITYFVASIMYGAATESKHWLAATDLNFVIPMTVENHWIYWEDYYGN